MNLTGRISVLAVIHKIISSSRCLWFLGFAGGSYCHHAGAAAEFVCLPRDPDLTTKFSSSMAFMYGSEYYQDEFGHDGGNDLPCSVCRSIAESSVLISW